MKHAPALLLLAALAPCLAAAATTPANDGPQPLGVFKAWTAATYGTGAAKACYAFTTTNVKISKPKPERYVSIGNKPKKPAKPKPKAAAKPPGMLTVTERASFRDEISLSQGITYAKDAKVVLAVGANKLKFFTKDNMAYALKGAATTKAFLGGASVIATATPPNGKPVTDTFGLDGFSDAYKAIQKACPASAKTPAAAKPKTTGTKTSN